VKLRVGQSLASAVDSTTVVVVRAPQDEVSVTCGGAEMVDPTATVKGTVGGLDPNHNGGSLLGKRYVAAGLELELLVTKAGEGSLAAEGVPLEVKAAKPLPSSD
jgi:hypothetical protein